MTRHRSSFILLMCSLTFAAALAATPGSAMAGSLLSGYGGPGSGAQALLGSTLINGTGTPPSGGSSGMRTQLPGAGNGNGSPTAGGGTGGQGAGVGGAAHAKGASGAQGKSGQSTTGAAGASNGSSAAYTSTGSPQPAVGTAAAADTGLLGLTGADVLLLALVLGVLAVTAGLTTRLARTQH
jgi:hypothetical protein